MSCAFFRVIDFGEKLGIIVAIKQITNPFLPNKWWKAGNLKSKIGALSRLLSDSSQLFFASMTKSKLLEQNKILQIC